MWFIPWQILFFYWILFDKTFFKVIYFFTLCCPWHCAYNILILCAIFVSFYVYILFKRQYFVKNKQLSFIFVFSFNTHIHMYLWGGRDFDKLVSNNFINSQLKRKICAKIFLNHPPSPPFFKSYDHLISLGKKISKFCSF